MHIQHLSVSRHDTWTRCEAEYRFRYHLKTVVEQEEPFYFLYGTVCHKIAEEYVRAGGAREINEIAKMVLSGEIALEKKRKPSQPAVLLDEDGEPIAVKEEDANPAEPEEEKPQPIHLPAEYAKKFPAHLRAIKSLTDQTGFGGFLEWEFKYDLDPPNGRNIVGFIDRLIQKGDKFWIIDYKTTKKGWWRKNAKTITTDLQLKVYCRIVQKLFNVPPENIKAALYFLEGPELVGATFTAEALEATEAYLRDTFIKIENTPPEAVYGNVGRHCPRCDYRKICPFYSLT